jgi:hypothetical protein
MTFTFDHSKDASFTDLQPLYKQVLDPKAVKPEVSLGNVDRATAEAWLNAQHARYTQAIGARSKLVSSINLLDRVTLVGLSDGSDA